MRTLLVCIALLFAGARLFGQTADSTSRVDSLVIPESQTLDLQFLIAEVLMNNPEIEASLRGMDVMDARVPQAGALDDPELKFTSEDMPGFDFNQPMYRRWELMQKIRFPSKLSAESELASIRAEHAHHDHQEKVIEVLERLKLAYYELWFVQQNMALTQENIRLMDQFAKIARTKYGVGLVPMQDVLKAQVETASLRNDLTVQRQQELSAKAMLMAILNRAPKDTLGFAVIPEEVEFASTLDSLEQLALNVRPMLIHDSLSVREGQAELRLAGKEYIPDFTIGIERVTSPADGFSGWSFSAGMTLPFAPWTLGKSSSRKDEASAQILRAQASYRASKAMVKASVRDHYYQVVSAKEQLENYRTVILPQAEQSLTASRTAYQTGTTNFLMLIDAYRSLVTLTKEYFMARMQFEQHVASLERAIGYQSLMATR